MSTDVYGDNNYSNPKIDEALLYFIFPSLSTLKIHIIYVMHVTTTTCNNIPCPLYTSQYIENLYPAIIIHNCLPKILLKNDVSVLKGSN